MTDKVSRTSKIFKGTNRAILIFGAVLLILVGIQYADSSKIISISDQILSIIILILTIVGVYFGASLLIRLSIEKVVSSMNAMNVEQRLLVMKFYSFAIYSIATTIILWRLGVTLQNIALIAGFLATGFAFAIREIILSYMIWFMLLTKKPFRIGDYVRVGDEEGIVKHIGTFYVLLDETPETYEDFIRIPNKIFLEKPVKNYGSGKIVEKIKLKVTNTKNIDKKLEQIRKIKTISTTRIDHDKDNIYLTAEYSTSIKEKNKRKTELTLQIIKILN